VGIANPLVEDRTGVVLAMWITQDIQPRRITKCKNDRAAMAITTAQTPLR
jgi:hypothetical protein